MNNPETISSISTLIYKILFPGIIIFLWVVVFGLFYYRHGDIKWIFSVLLILPSIMVFYFSFSLKFLALDSHFLYVFKNFRKNNIPLGDIKDVYPLVYVSSILQFLVIEFDKTTAVGEKILFLPKFPSGWKFTGIKSLYQENPIMEKLLKARKDI